MEMLTEVLQYLKNWFERTAYAGTFEIDSEGALRFEDGVSFDGYLYPGQYFRIVGSVLNDGVHQFQDAGLNSERFEGIIYGLAIPKAVTDIVRDIQIWQEKFGDAATTPFQTESYARGSYSYSKGGNLDGTTWKTAFASRLNPWRKA